VDEIQNELPRVRGAENTKRTRFGGSGRDAAEGTCPANFIGADAEKMRNEPDFGLNALFVML
jgi:hypothetical protein